MTQTKIHIPDTFPTDWLDNDTITDNDESSDRDRRFRIHFKWKNHRALSEPLPESECLRIYRAWKDIVSLPRRKRKKITQEIKLYSNRGLEIVLVRDIYDMKIVNNDAKL